MSRNAKTLVVVLAGLAGLLSVGIVVQQVQESSDLAKQRAQAEWDAQGRRLDASILEEKAKYIELVIGPMAANCFRATDGSFDAAEMVKHCGMSAPEAKRQSVRYPKLLEERDRKEKQRVANELNKLNKTPR
jgi:hypothetical protein